MSARVRVNASMGDQEGVGLLSAATVASLSRGAAARIGIIAGGLRQGARLVRKEAMAIGALTATVSGAWAEFLAHDRGRDSGC